MPLGTTYTVSLIWLIVGMDVESMYWSPLALLMMPGDHNPIKISIYRALEPLFCHIQEMATP
jgi:hypothetical protein